MKKIGLSLFCAFLVLCGCTQKDNKDTVKETNIEMEVTENYSTSDPFINARLFYVMENIETLHLEINFEMDGETGILELEEKDTGKILWNQSWKNRIKHITVPVTLHNIDKDKEYVIRFTGTKIKYAKVVMTSTYDGIKERSRTIHTKKD